MPKEKPMCKVPNISAQNLVVYASVFSAKLSVVTTGGLSVVFKKLEEILRGVIMNGML